MHSAGARWWLARSTTLGFRPAGLAAAPADGCNSDDWYRYIAHTNQVKPDDAWRSGNATSMTVKLRLTSGPLKVNGEFGS